MVQCFVPECNHQSERDVCRFLRFPKDPKIKQRWINLIRRADREPSIHSRVCTCHFRDGKKEGGPEIFQWNSDKIFQKSTASIPRKKVKKCQLSHADDATDKRATTSCSHEMQQLSVSKEDICPEQQESNPSVDQEDSKPLNIKEEQEELWINQEKQLHQLEETDFTRFPFTVVTVKIENDEEKPQLSHLYQSQTDDETETKPVVGSTTEHVTLKTEPEAEHCEGSHIARY